MEIRDSVIERKFSNPYAFENSIIRVSKCSILQFTCLELLGLQQQVMNQTCYWP